MPAAAPPPPGASRGASRDPVTGRVLEGRYRVDGVLARGGMSTVYRGLDLRLGRPVAIKVMTPSLAGDPSFVRRFEREARSAALLSHPGVVAVHDQGRDEDGTVFLVLELVEGGTLRDVLRHHGRLRPATALTVVEQVVTALRVAHARGLVHRDVKPENVLIGRDGAVKVADFGLVAAVRPERVGPDADRRPHDPDPGYADEGDTDDGTSTGGLLLGTVAYLSPEQVAEGRADARSDLYAAGIVLYELLTGVPPHSGDTPMAVAYRHVQADVPRPSALVGEVPPALDRLVLAATRRSPAERPADADAFLTAARGARVSASLPFAPVPAPPPRAAGTTPTTSSSRAAPSRHPWTGTRRLDDLDDLNDLNDLNDTDTDGVGDAGPADEADAVDDEPEAPLPPTRRRGPDDVDDRIERLERRRARTRSRRWFAAWVVVVTAATAAAGVAGWSIGIPG